MNVVLIGMRGSGKSTVARMLAKRLGRKYLELDQLIAAKTGMSIKEITRQQGWEYFRDRESEMVKEASAQENVVISTGGGVVLRPQNTVELKKSGLCIFLLASIDELSQRLGEAPHLPRLTENSSMRQELEDLWAERKELYEKAADAVIETGNKSPDEIAGEIVQLLEKRHIV